ncbi:TNF receptor-associated factor 5-like [Dysidea avara]|uniref:TNF receptor-associated factor 5-like n=1 Tax=Dysidea avara TaxID=196820 RepID=UPI00331CFD7D
MTKLKLSITEDTLAYTRATLASTETRLSNLEAVVKELVHKCTGSKMIVSAQTPIHIAVTTPITCPVIVKMPQYSCKYKKKTSSDWFSDSFYSSDKAYKMCLRVNAAGDGDAKGTHMSIHLYLMKGPYDDELTWPLRGRFSVTLLNQIRDWDHYQIKLSFNDDTQAGSAERVIDGDRAATGNGFDNFISNRDLHKLTSTCQYIREDCVFFKISKL